MAAKDVDYTKDWHLLSAWGNASQDIPREVMAHRSATRRAGTGENHIVQYRGFHLNRHQRYFVSAPDVWLELPYFHDHSPFDLQLFPQSLGAQEVMKGDDRSRGNSENLGL